MPTQAQIDSALASIDAADAAVLSGVQGPETALAHAKLACARAAALAVPPDPQPPFDRAEISGAGSAWCWFQTRRALLHQGKVFVGVVHDSRPKVLVLNPDATPAGPTLTFDLPQHDDHNNPGLEVVGGQAVACASRHGSDAYFQASVFGGQSWSAPAQVTVAGGGATYPSPLAEDSPRVRVRREHLSPGRTDHITCAVSAAGADLNSRVGVYLSGSGDHRPYAHAQAVGGKTWWWVTRNSGNHVGLNQELGLFYYDHAAGTWHAPDGAAIPGDPATSDPSASEPPRQRHQYVQWLAGVNPAGHALWNYDPVEIGGMPALAYQLVDPQALTCEYRLARVDAGGVPSVSVIAQGGRCVGLPSKSPHYTGGVSVGHRSDGSLVAACGAEVSGVVEVRLYASGDGGATWQHAGDVTAGSASDQIRPYVVDGADRVVWVDSGTLQGWDYASFGAARMMMAAI